MRIRKTVDFGNIRYVTNVNAPMLGNHNRRGCRTKGTSEAVKKANEQHAVDHAEQMLMENFKPHDWHIATTYSDEFYTDDYERVMKDKKNFISKLKRRCEKLGIDLKYLTMTERGVKSKKFHNHFVLPQEIPIKVLYECWPFGHIRILNTLYPDGDFRGLAQYYVDKTKGGQKEDDRRKGCRRYSFSKNCKKPVITYETNLSDTWRTVPIAPKGWMVKPGSIYNSTDSFGGYPYQKYILIRTDTKTGSPNRRE